FKELLHQQRRGAHYTELFVSVKNFVFPGISPNNKALIRRTRKLLPEPLSTTPALRFRLHCSEEVRILQSFKTLSSICFQQKTAQKQNRSTQIPDHIRNPLTASALRCRLCCSEEGELYRSIDPLQQGRSFYSFEKSDEPIKKEIGPGKSSHLHAPSPPIRTGLRHRTACTLRSGVYMLRRTVNMLHSAVNMLHSDVNILRRAVNMLHSAVNMPHSAVNILHRTVNMLRSAT
ncbi:hypothetical protein, partial [Zoogloea dura]